MESSYETKLRYEVLTKDKLSLSRWSFCGAFVLLSLISVLLVPTMIESESITVQHCYLGSMCFELENENALWRGRLSNIDLKSQVISLRMIPQSSEKLDFSWNLSLSIIGVDNGIATEGNKIDTSAEDCNIKCDSDICNECNLLYLPIIEYSSYMVELTFLNSIPEEVTSIDFEWSFINHDFTVYQLTAKYFYFSLSVVSLVIYLLSLRAVPYRNLDFESKLIAVMSVSLVIFNEPLFILNIYEPSEGMFVISAFCIKQFLFIQIALWFIIVEGNTEFRSITRCYLRVGIVLAAIFVVSGTFYAESDLENRYGFNHQRKNDRDSCFYLFYIQFCFFVTFYDYFSLKNKRSNLFLAAAFILLSSWCLIGGFIRSSPKQLSLSTFLISEYNFIVLLFAFYRAPRRVSVIRFQEFKELGQDLEEDFEEVVDCEITKKKSE